MISGVKIQVNSQNENDFKFWSESNRRSYIWRYIASIFQHLLVSSQKIKKDLSLRGNSPSRKVRPGYFHFYSKSLFKVKYYTHSSYVRTWRRRIRPEMFCRKNFLIKILQNSQENTCARVSFLVKHFVHFFFSRIPLLAASV